MGISIEIDSNKRMKKDYIKSFKLTFKDKDLEKKVLKKYRSLFLLDFRLLLNLRIWTLDQIPHRQKTSPKLFWSHNRN